VELVEVVLLEIRVAEAVRALGISLLELMEAPAVRVCLVVAVAMRLWLVATGIKESQEATPVPVKRSPVVAVARAVLVVVVAVQGEPVAAVAVVAVAAKVGEPVLQALVVTVEEVVTVAPAVVGDPVAGEDLVAPVVVAAVHLKYARTAG